MLKGGRLEEGPVKKISEQRLRDLPDKIDCEAFYDWFEAEADRFLATRTQEEFAELACSDDTRQNVLSDAKDLRKAIGKRFGKHSKCMLELLAPQIKKYEEDPWEKENLIQSMASKRSCEIEVADEFESIEQHGNGRKLVICVVAVFLLGGAIIWVSILLLSYGTGGL